ncbi:MAG: DUF4270 family protein [Williamsia sp.]|nr:DUF4270 family protein [Williamsia sp.]
MTHMIQKFLLPLLALCSLSSCYKKDIQFGTDLGDTYINLASIDTVAVEMSTVVQDSFATNNPSVLLIGNYKDPYLGRISASPFFQVGLPSDPTLEDNAVYDSLDFIIKPNGNYYGDTTKPLTLVVRELDQTIAYTYGSQLFNTSSIPVKTEPLGSKTVGFSPARDSILMRLGDNKGRELFSKLKDHATETTTSTDFLNYFKGISVAAGTTDTSQVFGVKAVADSVKMRLYYHISTPYPESKFKDFAITPNDLAFNQVLTNRSGTKLQAGTGTGVQEFSSTVTANQSYLQSSAGVLLKLSFPSLRNILQLNSTVELVSATLVVRIADNSFDQYRYKLPPELYLAQTDASNTVGTSVTDAAGTGVLYSAPLTDYVYNTNATYSFPITSSIKTLLATAGSTANGFFLLEKTPGDFSSFNRLIANDAHHGSVSSQLVLSVVTIKND